MTHTLTINALHVAVEKKTILENISLAITPGSIHALMGKNGSGKSSLAYTLMGHPRYTVTQGTITYGDEDITHKTPDMRAKKGLFLATQNPIEIEGVTFQDFLRQAYNSLHTHDTHRLSPKEFIRYLHDQCDTLNIPHETLTRALNVGFSGGEKKKAEMLQLAVLRPKIAILDELDSGLDIDAIKTVCSTLQTIKEKNPSMSFLIISHNPRIFDFLRPDVVHILQQGKLIQSGSADLINHIQTVGFNI